MTQGPKIHVVGRRVRVWHGGGESIDVDVGELAGTMVDSADRGPRDGLIPSGVRFWLERGSARAIAIEIPPHARTVRWIRDDSPEPYGSGATYERHWIAFPYIILLLVFNRGRVTGLEQLFYRNRPLDADESLYYSNLPNVTTAGLLKSWICLQNLKPVGRLSWCEKIEAIGRHVLCGSFNWSCEHHEGSSMWSSMRGLDPRLETIRAWHAATEEDPLFATRIRWKPTGTTMRDELMEMLELVVPPRKIESATDLAGLVTLARNRRKARR